MVVALTRWITTRGRLYRNDSFLLIGSPPMANGASETVIHAQ